jgi:iron complex outermembrane receptor protein
MRTRSMIERAVALALAANAPLIVQAQTASDVTASRELEEVTVTATRRETSLQDAPVAVQVLDERSLGALNVGSFQDYLKYTPGMQGGGSAEPGRQFIEMRGVGAYGGNLAQAGTIGAKASVAVYLDETPVTAGATGSRNVDLYVTDMNRVEVLAGPQGTLFGSASMSGAVRMISNKADPRQFDARVALSAGHTQGSGDLNRTVEGMVNLPLIQDRLALRVAAYSAYSAGYLDNTPATSTLAVNTRIVNDKTGKYANTTYDTLDNFNFQPKDMNDAEYKGARASATLNITDNWRLLAQFTKQKLDTGGPFAFRDDIGDLKVARYEPEFLHDDFQLGAVSLEGRIAALDVIYNGSYLERAIDQQSDYLLYTEKGPTFPYYICDYPNYTHCEAPKTDWTVKSDFRSVAHELRVASDPSNRVSFVAGVYYHKNGCAPPKCGTSIDFNYYGAAATGFPQNAPMSGAISYIPEPRKPGTMFFTDMSPIVEELSWFGDVTVNFTPKFTASVGARHYKIDQSAVGSVNFGSRVNQDSGFNFSDNLRPRSESDVIKRLNVTYAPTPDVRWYATYSEGFSTGGYNRTGGVRGPTGIEVPLGYDTEKTANYEVGWKTTIGHRARFNGAVYRIDWDGIVVGILDTSITTALFFVNAGKARIKGLEADLTYLLNDNWSVEGALAVTDSELTSIPPTVPNIVPVGSQLARQPVLGGNVRLRYDFNLLGNRAYAVVGAIHQGSRYNSVNPTRTKSPSYTVYDLNVGATWNENWETKLFVHNLLNDRYEISRSEVPTLSWVNKVIGRPRTVGFNVAYHF